ncbi:MAG: hypothetical protein NTV34_14660 [Proteobacteria bacterium]|nr:hypothetical protein [Pseudomonadota bacterium]
MQIILDECIPRKLKKIFVIHDVKTVPEAGWAGKKNGELLTILEGNCDFFITVDANLLHQQPAKARPFGIAVIVAPSNRLRDLEPIASRSLLLFSAENIGKVFELK